jgi:hypothetical protein
MRSFHVSLEFKLRLFLRLSNRRKPNLNFGRSKRTRMLAMFKKDFKTIWGEGRVEENPANDLCLKNDCQNKRAD